jgi:hypothetical protein
MMILYCLPLGFIKKKNWIFRNIKSLVIIINNDKLKSLKIL